MPAAAEETASSTPARSGSTLSTSHWVDVTGQVLVTRSSYGHQFGAQPFPGIKIVQRQVDGSSKKCTIGPAVIDTVTSKYGFISAGHCDYTPGRQTYVYADPAETVPVAVGIYTAAVIDDDAPTGVDVDSAVVWTGSANSTVSKIAGRWPIKGVLTVAGARALPVGTPICIDGAVSGVVCSPLISTSEDVRYRRTSEGGDSGAVVFTVDDTGSATLIGVHQGIDDTNTEGMATFLEPVLTRLGAHVVTDPAASAVTETGYSPAVTPYR